jgi:hypothetical protein
VIHATLKVELETGKSSVEELLDDKPLYILIQIDSPTATLTGTN